MNKKKLKYRSWLPFIVSILVAAIILYWMCGLVFNRLDNLTNESTMQRMDVLQDVERVQDRVWGSLLTAALPRMAGSATLEHMAYDIAGIGLQQEIVEALTGSQRDSVLEGLRARLSDEQQARVKDFTVRADEAMRELNANVQHYELTRAALLTEHGDPYVRSGEGMRRFTPETHKILERCMREATLQTLPAYRLANTLFLDVLVPVLEPVIVKPSVARRAVGVLLVTIDVKKRMAQEEAAGLKAIQGARALLVEEQGDGNLGLLSFSNSGATLPLHKWEAKGDLLPFAVRHIPEVEGSQYVMGTRVASTNIFLASALDRSFADDSMLLEANTIRVFTALVLAGMLAVLLVFWYVIYGRQERRFEQRRTAELDKTGRRRQIVFHVGDALPLPIACCDFDNHLTWANDAFAKLAGKKEAADVAGRPIQILPQDMAINMARHASAVWTSGKVEESEDKLSAGGLWHTYKVYACPYVDKDGYLAGTINIYRDVTETLQNKTKIQSLTEQTVASLHRLFVWANPYYALQSATLAEVAILLARLDGDETQETAHLLSMAGRLSKLGLATLGDGQDADAALRESQQRLGGLLGSVDFSGQPVPQALADMNERLDGSGFPRGIAGDLVGKPARYLAIADAIVRSQKPKEGTPAPLLPLLDAMLADDPAKYDRDIVQKAKDFFMTEQGQAVLHRLRDRVLS